MVSKPQKVPLTILNTPRMMARGIRFSKKMIRRTLTITITTASSKEMIINKR